MAKGKRYEEGSLNYKKVFAVIIAIVVVVMFVIIVKNLIEKGKNHKNTIPVEYYALYQDKKWGVINTLDEIVIEPMYQEMITVLDKEKDVFLCTYDINEENGEYKTKVVNKENQEIFTNYEEIEALDNYNQSGNAWYEENILKVKKDGKYGLIDINGKQILEPQYDSIETLKGPKNSIIIEKDGKYGLVNNSGTIIIKPEFTKIEAMSEQYKDGYLTIDENNKYGLIDFSGKQILENNYEKIEKIPGDKYFVIEEKNQEKLINTSGEKILENGFDEIAQITAEGVVIKKDKLYGFMTYDGEMKIEPKYDDLKQINSGILKAETNKTVGLIDLDENEKLGFNYTDIYYENDAGIYIAENSNFESDIIDSEFNIKLTGILSEINIEKGYMKLKIDDEYKYYNFKFEEKNVSDILNTNTLFVSKKDGKYGYVNKDGNVVVDYTYDEALEQNKYGYAAVKKDGLWGAIDKTGNIVIEPKYELENNLVIDFIGKWHLGQDLNMNYYCEK